MKTHDKGISIKLINQANWMHSTEAFHGLPIQRNHKPHTKRAVDKYSEE